MLKQIGIIDCIYTISRVFLDIFVLAYIFQITKQSVFFVGIYYFVAAVTMIAIAVFLGNFLSKGFFIQTYRLGILFNILFFIVILYLNKNVLNNVILFGVLLSLSVCLRGVSRNFLICEYISENLMIRFRGYLEFIKTCLKIIFPVIFGFLISDNFNFTKISFILFILLFIEYISTIPIKNTNKKYKFNLTNFIKFVKQNKLFKNSFFMEFFRGMTILGVLPVAITLYIIYLFKTNFNLGLLTSVFSLIILVVNLLFGKYCKYGYFVNVLKFSGIVAIVFSLLFIVLPNKTTFILYNISLVTAMQFIWLLTEVNMFNIAETIRNKFQTEYFVFREIVCGLGKIISFIIFIIIGYFGYFVAIKYFLLFLTVGISCMVFYAIKINKQLFKSI